jgi:hypothetical protein
MIRTAFQGRRAAAIENESLRVTVLEEGGHIAEILHKRSGINPLWVPPWTSLEPSQYDPATNPEYGAGAEGKLLAGIMGHNLCLDVFGGPSAPEAAAGLTVHGEASVLPYQIAGADTETGAEMTTALTLPMAHLHFMRQISLHGASVRIDPSHELYGLRLNAYVSIVVFCCSTAFFVWWQLFRRDSGEPRISRRRSKLSGRSNDSKTP